jgi:hypothetical protein
MRKLIISTMVVSLAIFQPINALEILSSIKQSENHLQFIEQFLTPDKRFDVNKSRRFLCQLKNEIKTQYGIDIDMLVAIDQAIRILTQTGQFSEEEITMARQFYSQLIKEDKTETRVFNSKKSRKKKNKKRSKGQEFVLPDKMAGGFMCILGGAILCILPFGITQGIGTGLVTTGIYSIIDSSSSGGRPYYLDTETGQRIPLGQKD